MDDTMLDWLAEPDNPSVRYLTLTTLLGKQPDDPDVVSARAAIMQSGPVPAILASQNEDGSWGLAEKFYTDKYGGTVWMVLLLAELHADPTDPQIKKACEFLLHHAWDSESGGFSMAQSMKTGLGLASGIIPCLTGNMTYSLIRLGLFEDPRVQKAIDWITTWQRADDGIEQTLDNPVYKRYEPCWGRHSCHMGVAKSLKALTAIPIDRRNPAVESKIMELTDYFLLHRLYRKSHHLEEVAKPGWLRLGFPLMYQTDILELLGLFRDLGYEDERLRDALEIVKSKRQPDGRWNLENTFNGKIRVRIESKGKPSKWITLKALQVLH